MAPIHPSSMLRICLLCGRGTELPSAVYYSKHLGTRSPALSPPLVVVACIFGALANWGMMFRS
uniref:Uncharacterized protein n=1 Tax=Arundo donax TaxID=35708 RepID=A0A0A9FEF5_ARUDO